MRMRRLLGQAWQGLSRNLTMTVAGVLTVMIAVGLLGGALTARASTNRIRDNLVNQLNVSVFLDPKITQTELADVKTRIDSLPGVASVSFISQDEAYQIFRSTQPPSLVRVTPKSLLPPSYVLNLVNPQRYDAVYAEVYSALGCQPDGTHCTTAGVSGVSDVNATINKVLRVLHGITLGALFVAIIALVVAALLIYNAMQVSAFSRRREISIMRLVGASALSIQAPFVIEGAAIGLVGSALAVGFLLLGRQWILHSQVASGALTPFGEMTYYVGSLPWVLIVGIGLSALLSFLTLQRHLRV